ncbi:MAG: protein translocase subunit SecF, partial [Brachymonas sp.]|nr:protein translocase subunit SecF [Brachymonas sp.]
MEFFRIRKVIPFMRYARMLNIISAVTFALAVFFLVTRGLHLSVEFTGGTLMEVTYTRPAPIDAVRGAIEQMGYKDVVVQNYGSSQEVLIRLPLQQGVTSVQQSSQVMDALKAQDGSVSLRRVEFIGPQVGKELLGNGIKALAFVVIGIIIYLALRFEWKYAVSAIVANLHDIIIILGFFAFFQWEVSLSVLAAVLAVLGYSVNESVVVFDRVRENFRHFRKMGTVDVINHAITSTTSRTIITHGSTLMMVLSMQLFGGE